MALRHLLSFIFCTIFLNASEVLLIGDILVDHIIFVDDDYLKTIPGKKGGCQTIEESLLEKIILEKGASALMAPGGNGVNVMKGLAHLGHQCHVVGKIGMDSTGDFFAAAMAEKGIKSSLTRLPCRTGHCISLVTPDRDRTLRTFLGASAQSADLGITSKTYEEVRLFHLEGYQLYNEANAKKMVSEAKKAGAKVSMDLACFEVVQAHRELILELLNEVDILLCNKDEAATLTGLGPKEACELLAKSCKIAIITMGKDGCYAQEGNELVYQPAIEVSVLDTTGAGDYFASGVLHGYLEGRSLKDSIRYGAIIASHVICVEGAEIPEDRWEIIQREVQ